ncbi:putative ABC transporter permease [Geobacter grbiciae]|uniref:putative ABC transporter permease n=1 Tax=Geobacter grbiciae TaxID=155042 RepID=UPI001FE4E9FD|nr:HD domain-containing protein [Geobacter grbiciae]
MIDYFFTFSCFAILGWLLEVAYRSSRAGRFVNPGLLKGPYLILYGTGALVLMGATALLQTADAGFAVKTLVYFVATTGLELLSGVIAQRLFHAHLWDYSDERFHYKGHICLKFSLYWIALAFAFEYLVVPPYRVLLGQFVPVVKSAFAGVVLSFMLVDLLMTAVRTFFRITQEESALADAEFRKAATPVLALPDVARLSQYPHHRGKTRLYHVKEVAHLSFLLGRRLSLDGEAIIRGALLHDLFFYDWLREGPRLHGFRHHTIALNNARRITRLSQIEEDIIKKHMWPLTLVPPLYPESLIVSLVDTYCTIRDYLPLDRQDKPGNTADGCAGPTAEEKLI